MTDFGNFSTPSAHPNIVLEDANDSEDHHCEGKDDYLELHKKKCIINKAETLKEDNI